MSEPFVAYADALLKVEAALIPLREAFTVHEALRLQKALDESQAVFKETDDAGGAMHEAAHRACEETQAMLSALGTALRTFRPEDELQVIDRARRWRRFIG